jgi:hypothetical protein
MNRWNEFQRFMADRYRGARQTVELYRGAKEMARESGQKGLSGSELGLLAIHAEQLPVDGPEAPITNRADDFELDDFALEEAPVPGPVVEAPAPRPYEVYEAPAPPPTVIDAPAPIDEAYASAVDVALNTTDIDMRENLLRTIMEHRGVTGLVGPLGRPLPMDKLLQMAQLLPIWRDLSDEQRASFLDTAGFLRDGKPYVSKRIVEKPQPTRKTYIQLSDGTKLRI